MAFPPSQSRFRCTCTWTWFRRELLLKHILKQCLSLQKHSLLKKSHGAQQIETLLKRPLSFTKEPSFLYESASFRYRYFQTASPRMVGLSGSEFADRLRSARVWGVGPAIHNTLVVVVVVVVVLCILPPEARAASGTGARSSGEQSGPPRRWGLKRPGPAHEHHC